MFFKANFYLLLLVTFSLVLFVSAYPRKKFVSKLIPNENRRSSLLSSVLSDYWSDRGFHDALTDHLLASESQSKDLMLTGDEVEDFQGIPKIRIPRQRLTPPLRLSASRKRMRRPRLQVTPATRKQDMEILESVTLVDGGTQLPDGRIQIRPSTVQYQRKYHDGQISPLSYHLQDDIPNYKLPSQQPQNIQHQQAQTPYHTLPFIYRQQQHQRFPHGKPPVAEKIPKTIEQLSLPQFQNQLLQAEQPQQHSLHSLYSSQAILQPPSPTSQQPKKQVSIFVLPSPTTTPKPRQPLISQVIHAQPQKQHQKSQLFQQQYNHPFGAQTSEPGPLAKFTAALLSTAGSAAAAASAAATALSQSELVTAYRQNDLPKISSPLASFSQQLSPSLASFSQQISESAVDLAEIPYSPRFPSQLYSSAVSAQSSQQSPQILLPTTTQSSFPPTTFRPGVIADEAQILQNQLVEPESLAKKLTRIYETGRKILYFPKGVVDTVDTVLKQMERNPTVAYWGDKFFAKVFGDTSGT